MRLALSELESGARSDSGQAVVGFQSTGAYHLGIPDCGEPRGIRKLWSLTWNSSAMKRLGVATAVALRPTNNVVKDAIRVILPFLFPDQLKGFVL